MGAWSCEQLLSLCPIAPLTVAPQLDYPDENIIDELKHTNAFIDEGVKSGGNVLIHW